MRVLLLVLFLQGCSLFGTGEVVEVKVPVSVPCIDSKDIPAEIESASEVVRKDDEPGIKIKAILIEREKLRQADTRFRAIVRGCLK